MATNTGDLLEAKGAAFILGEPVEEPHFWQESERP
jgi:hypothetical protein